MESNVMKALQNRYKQASELTDALVELVLDKAEKRVGSDGKAIYSVGYLNSVLRSVAASSPAAIKELEQILRAARA
jgi:hypothetical protein